MPPKTKKKTPKASKPLVPEESVEQIEEEYFGVIDVHFVSLQSKVETGTFTLIVVYGNIIVGKINKVVVPPEGGTVDINEHFTLKIKSADDYVMDALLSTPFFFSMLEGENRADLNRFNEIGFAAAVQPNVTGQGNLSVLPLLTGQVETESSVVLEPPGYQETLFFKRKYSEHPKLLIRLTDVKKNLSSIKLNNIMWTTVESIYNVDPTNFLEYADHTCVFPMPATSIASEEKCLDNMISALEKPPDILPEEKKTYFAKKGKKILPKKIDSKQQVKPILKKPNGEKKAREIKRCIDFDLIQFDRGIYTEDPTIDIRKKWSSLASINGAPAMTKDRIKTDGSDLLSPIPLDIAKKFRNETEPRIEWNMVRPIWLHEELETNFKNRILQYGVWPLELIMLGNMYVDQDQKPPNKKAKLLKQDQKKIKALQKKIDGVFDKFQKIVYDSNEQLNQNQKNTRHIDMKIGKLKREIENILLEHKERRKLLHKQLEKLSRKEKEKKKKKGEKKISSRNKKSSKTKRKVKKNIMNEEKEKLTYNTNIFLEKKAYIAWVDLSPLLSPGCSQLRTVGLLQHFNKEEAIAKWGLATTFSAEPDEMVSKDKDFSNLCQRDPKKLFQCYGHISKLLKKPTSILLLLGRLMDLRYKLNEKIVQESPKIIKCDETAVEDENIEGIKQNSKKMKIRFNPSAKEGKDKKLPLNNESKGGELKTDSSKTKYDNFLNEKENRGRKPQTLQISEDLTKIGSPKLNNSQKMKTLHQLPETLSQQIKSNPKPTSYLASSKTSKKEMTRLQKNILLVKQLKLTLYRVVLKYCQLRKRYKCLVKVNKKQTKKIESIFTYRVEDKTKSQIRKVEPRHKLWHYGGKLSANGMRNQIEITNVVRKLAVLERKYLLLKRLRLADVKKVWMEKARNLNPQYFKNKVGKNVFVVIEIKLLKPLVPKPSLNKLELNIKELLRNYSKPQKPLCYLKDPFGDFKDCIATLTNIIRKEYQDYKHFYTCEKGPHLDDVGFYDYLEKSKAHKIIAESLSEVMTIYLNNAFGNTNPYINDTDQNKLKYYVGWLYSRLMEEMHLIVNKIAIDGDRSLPGTCDGDLPNITNKELYFFAVEAIEEMDYDRAKYYLSKRLEGKNREDPIKWIEYAVIALRIGDFQPALECIKEALILDTRCKEGLIMYAVMLMMEGKFNDAQIFFDALINFHPTFVEGWIAFHMFYLITENECGAGITLAAGTKIARDHVLPCSYRPSQLAWNNNSSFMTEPGCFMSTAVYFLSFNLYEFAEVCLAQELERVRSKSSAWVYYLSVCHYIQGRYEDSAKHLVKAITEALSFNTEPHIWLLLGHNCWQMGLKKCAVQLYIQAFTKNETTLYAHMTYIRCGYFFLENEQHEFAKQMFLRAVKDKGTPMGWLGLGIALFMGGEIDDAELALREANMLDTTLATAWGYLALICLYKLKHEHFLHCFNEAKRYGLKDKKLAIQIELASQEIMSYMKSEEMTEKESNESKKKKRTKEKKNVEKENI